MLAQMIAYYIERNVRTFLNVLLVEYHGGRKKNGSKEKYRKWVPAKVLWYFPLIPRFKRLFQSPQTVKDLTWHANERGVYGKLRHLADSPAWKLVDDKWPSFASESRNLRLALFS